MVDDDSERAACLAAARQGDDRAVTVLFRALHPRLVRFLAAHEPTVADDLAAEVWVALAAALPGFDGTWDELRALAFTIARRRMIDHRRRGARRRTDPVADEHFAGLASADAPEREAADRDDARHAVRRIAELLPPDQAEVVLLRVLGGFDVAEVAEIMGRTANWVRVNQHRAVRRLADRLDTELDLLH